MRGPSRPRSAIAGIAFMVAAAAVIAGAALIIASGLYLFHAEAADGAKARRLRRRGRSD